MESLEGSRAQQRLTKKRGLLVGVGHARTASRMACVARSVERIDSRRYRIRLKMRKLQRVEFQGLDIHRCQARRKWLPWVQRWQPSLVKHSRTCHKLNSQMVAHQMELLVQLQEPRSCAYRPLQLTRSLRFRPPQQKSPLHRACFKHDQGVQPPTRQVHHICEQALAKPVAVRTLPSVALC